MSAETEFFKLFIQQLLLKSLVYREYLINLF